MVKWNKIFIIQSEQKNRYSAEFEADAVSLMKSSKMWQCGTGLNPEQLGQATLASQQAGRVSPQLIQFFCSSAE